MEIRTALAACTIAALTLTGCGGDPAPKVAEPPPPSATPAPPPSTTVAPVPTSGPVSARDYLRRWVQLDVEMQNSGDSGSYRAAFPVCAVCKKLASTVDRYYRNGGYIRFTGHTIAGIDLFASDGETATYDVRAESLLTEYMTSATGNVKTLEGGPSTLRATIQRRGETWTLTDYFQVPS